MGYDEGNNWRAGSWTTSATRRTSGCGDVYLRHADHADANLGEPIANLVASTTGTDARLVVKLIDVYPAEVGAMPPWEAITDDRRRYFPRPLRESF